MRMPLLALAALCLALPLSAAQENFGAGSQAAPWLKLSNNARSSAMGEAGVAVADDVNASSVNPAGLVQIKGQQVAFMHHAYIMDSAVEHLAYGFSPMEGLGLAVSLDYMNFGPVDAYTLDSATNQLKANGSFTPTGYHLDLGAGYAFGSLSAGINAKMVSESVDGSTAASAFGADLGALWRSEGGLSLGATLQNAGSQLNGSSLPMGVRAGGAYRLALGGRDALIGAADASVPSADTAATSFGAGLEYAGQDLYAVRAGYKAAGNGGAGGFTLGAGIKYNVIQLDYAFSSVGILGNSNQLSALLKF